MRVAALRVVLLVGGGGIGGARHGQEQGQGRLDVY